jgi:hypothetical protein
MMTFPFKEFVDCNTLTIKKLEDLFAHIERSYADNEQLKQQMINMIIQAFQDQKK